MNQLKSLTILFVVALLFSLHACSVDEGVGGTAKISGTLQLVQMDEEYAYEINRLPAIGENIYIRYGNSEAVGDRVRTSETGYFEFDFLYSGKYTIFYVTQDSLTGQDTDVSIEVNVTKGEHKQLGELESIQALDWDDGKATITGQVIEVLKYYPGAPRDTIPAQDKEVYLKFNNSVSYVERIRTDYNGYFEFPKLIPGTYEVYVFSESYNSNADEVVTSELQITEFTDSVYDLGILYIDNY